MSTSTSRSPAEQKAWVDGYNTALELAAKYLEPNPLVESIRGMMMPDGPSTQEINAALGIDTCSVTSQNGKSL